MNKIETKVIYNTYLTAYKLAAEAYSDIIDFIEDKIDSIITYSNYQSLKIKVNEMESDVNDKIRGIIEEVPADRLNVFASTNAHNEIQNEEIFKNYIDLHNKLYDYFITEE